MQNEFEIKLTGPPAVIAGLPSSALMSAIARVGECEGEGGWTRLENRYFDTPDGLLGAHDISLRKRLRGGDIVQTVKAGRGALRTEWEIDLGDGVFPAPTGEATIDAVLEEALPSLGEITSITIDRWATRTNFRQSVIEIAVDIGGAKALDGAGRARHAPLAEVELELVSGARDDVFSLAKLLIENMGLRLGAKSKLARAQAAATGADYAIEKRLKPRADANQTASDVLQNALAASAHRIAGLQAPLINMRSAEALQKLRVELRRVRAVERVFRRHTGGRQLRSLAQTARGFGRSLGPARDWDVFLRETMGLITAYDYSTEGFSYLRAEAHKRRAEAWAKAMAIVASDEFSAFLLELYRAAWCAPWASRAENAT